MQTKPNQTKPMKQKQIDKLNSLPLWAHIAISFALGIFAVGATIALHHFTK